MAPARRGPVSAQTVSGAPTPAGYDKVGLRATETTKSSGSTVRTVTTAYDAAGKPTTRTATGASASTEARRYDGNGQLVELDFTIGGSTVNYDLTWDTTAAVPQPPDHQSQRDHLVPHGET